MRKTFFFLHVFYFTQAVKKLIGLIAYLYPALIVCLSVELCYSGLQVDKTQQLQMIFIAPIQLSLFILGC